MSAGGEAVGTVLITGMGAVSCQGTGRRALWSAMGAAPVTLPSVPPDPSAHMALPALYRVADLPDGPGSRTARLAVAAATQAIEDAGLDLEDDGATVGLVLGTCMGDAAVLEDWRAGGAAPGADWLPAFGIAGAVAEVLGPVGVTATLSNACAASGFALGVAADLIRAGEADVVLVGGADAYSRIMLGSFNRMGAVDPVRCRPFDRHRRGTVFGEAAGMLVFESERHANARGATALARFGGSGWSCDAYHPTAPEPSGEQIGRSMYAALAAAGTIPAGIGAVIPHGTGTELNDLVESHVLHDLVGADTPLYSLKALIGHTGGAAAALAAVAGVQMLRYGTVPPNVPVDEQDPECKVWLPQGDAVPLTAPRVLLNGYAFGGNNVSVVLAAA